MVVTTIFTYFLNSILIYEDFHFKLGI